MVRSVATAAGVQYVVPELLTVGRLPRIGPLIDGNGELRPWTIQKLEDVSSFGSHGVKPRMLVMVLTPLTQGASFNTIVYSEPLQRVVPSNTNASSCGCIYPLLLCRLTQKCHFRGEIPVGTGLAKS